MRRWRADRSPCSISSSRRATTSGVTGRCRAASARTTGMIWRGEARKPAALRTAWRNARSIVPDSSVVIVSLLRSADAHGECTGQLEAIATCLLGSGITARVSVRRTRNAVRPGRGGERTCPKKWTCLSAEVAHRHRGAIRRSVRRRRARGCGRARCPRARVSASRCDAVSAGAGERGLLNTLETHPVGRGARLCSLRTCCGIVLAGTGDQFGECWTRWCDPRTWRACSPDLCFLTCCLTGVRVPVLLPSRRPHCGGVTGGSRT